MPGTFSQIYIQLVFAVHGRQSLIQPAWEEELYKYITGIVRNKDQKVLAINGMSDHIHILVGVKPSCRISDLVREIKNQRTISLKNGGLFHTDSIGRRDTVLFHIVNQRWIMSLHTLAIRKSIIRNIHFKRSINHF